jgi:integrase
VSEALGLTWSDIDLDRGVVRLDVNKTDDPRSWVLGEDVRRAIAAWRKMRGSKVKRSPHVFPSALLGHATDLAHLLREGLTLAGVKRPELTEPKPGRMLLRAHDLRGSFVTLALANGRTEAWVTDRTGHRSSQMIYLYKRASRTAAELGLGWFTPLDEAIPELAPKSRQGANGVQTGGRRGSQRSRGGPRNPVKQAVSRRVRTGRVRLLTAGSLVRVQQSEPV